MPHLRKTIWDSCLNRYLELGGIEPNFLKKSFYLVLFIQETFWAGFFSTRTLFKWCALKLKKKKLNNSFCWRVVDLWTSFLVKRGSEQEMRWRAIGSPRSTHQCAKDQSFCTQVRKLKEGCMTLTKFTQTWGWVDWCSGQNDNKKNRLTLCLKTLIFLALILSALLTIEMASYFI